MESRIPGENEARETIDIATMAEINFAKANCGFGDHIEETGTPISSQLPFFQPFLSLEGGIAIGAKEIAGKIWISNMEEILVQPPCTLRVDDFVDIILGDSEGPFFEQTNDGVRVGTPFVQPAAEKIVPPF